MSKSTNNNLNKQPILLLSSGRSGSTLLQRILNTSEDLTIWGEHAGIFSGIARSYFEILEGKPLEKFYFSKVNKINASLINGEYAQYNININWLNSFEKEKSKEIYRNFIFSILNQQKNLNASARWGFKEIRYTFEDKTVDMFVNLFPETQFIFSVRNPFDIILSMMFAFFPEEKRNSALINSDLNQLQTNIKIFAQRLSIAYKSIDVWINEKKVNSIIIRYEDLLNDKNKTVKTIFSFLNIDLPVNSLNPFNIKLQYTGNSPFHSEMKDIIFTEKNNITKILGDYPAKYGYNFDFSN